MSNLLEQHFQQSITRTFGLLMLSLVCVGITVCTHCQSAMAQETGETPTGSSHRSHRAAGIKAIPFAKLNGGAQKRIKDVVTRPSFYRRLPVQTIDADPEYFRLLVRRPELIVSIWQLMGVTQMSTERTGPFTVKTNDGAGTISDLELVYGNDNLHVFYGNGSYTGTMLRQKLTGRCVIVLQTQATETATGFDLASTLDIYLKVDNATASLITRTIQPLVGTTADHNFTESLKFVQRLNQSTRSNGPGVKGMGRKLKIDNQVRKEFEVVVDKVYARANQKSRQASLGKQRANLGNRASAPTARAQQTTRAQMVQPRSAQTPAKVSRRVKAIKPVASSQSAQIKRQPVVSPNMIASTSQASDSASSQFVRATDSFPQARRLSPVNAQVAAPVKLNLTDTVPRQGFSVLVGGPRDLTDKASAVVSVADSSKIANPDFDSSGLPNRSSQR